MLANLVDVGLCQIHLAAQVREIRGDLLVEGDLCFQVLVTGELALVEPREQGREHGLEFVRRFRHGEEDVPGLRRGLGWWRRDLTPSRSNPAGDFASIRRSKSTPVAVDVTDRSRKGKRRWGKNLGRGMKEALNTSCDEPKDSIGIALGEGG